MLLVNCLRNIALLTLCVYPLTKIRWFRNLVNLDAGYWDRIRLACIFGGLSVLGIVIGHVSLNDAIINHGIVGAAISGLIGGVWAGGLTGLIGAGFRIYFGGFAFLGDAISILLCGLISGLIRQKAGKHLQGRQAFLIGICLSVLHMAIIALVTHPSIVTYAFLSIAAPSSIVSNSLGVFLLIIFMNDIERTKDLEKANATELAFEIAKQTLPIIRANAPLTHESTSLKRVSKIIHDKTAANAIAIADSDGIRAYHGLCDHHHAICNGGSNLLSPELMARTQNEEYVLHGKNDILCADPDCQLISGVTVALTPDADNSLYLSLYSTRASITLVEIKMLTGIATLLSQQMLLSKHEAQKKLLARAEYNTLKTQLNPHFLFNSLSAIKSLIRTSPECAQDLIVNLSSLLRRSLSHANDLILFSDELAATRLYLQIQAARFGERLWVDIKVPEECNQYLFPSFCLQPLVENCMIHGFKDKEGEMQISIDVRYDQDSFLVTVTDNGTGFEEEHIRKVFEGSQDKATGIGLVNIYRRLQLLFPGRHSFELRNIGSGSQVLVVIPLIVEGGNLECVS